MTDKQIIDVTKCIHFDKSDIPNGCTCYWNGECNHNCYYKQLKRKEQECEEYKQALDEIKEIAKENIRIADLEELNGTYRRGLAKQILQKISEVEDE